ncbi:hypothetical protein GLOIN_2v1591748 [Rhizophagus irregularis DAOM 181602=DAOM 197198]|uniref:Uncharacterized protein n=1 Tax=Rhizophagus irregularis (strain DAOM 181602 / DAOM 197198 / MUCL 43194) TaxID=747089 RepID=A0A2P4Q5H2_RHIID|nr:hypothetical protein GLOIN_2v1591748 [Rhizophagus irregularis DAOM 181602=DAOM 197198]POG72893.1 hypothetical protein GLOIN_2v1591748 [Rhizophagus irregularis DAOM 181602=DAOM 197198]|eukprot:XP_025179759.1 hypothetical protein GLOIN_2v1591748 [Rhizophagus irregularis DAOM 181602=DAOM 197198]
MFFLICDPRKWTNSSLLILIVTTCCCVIPNRIARNSKTIKLNFWHFAFPVNFAGKLNRKHRDKNNLTLKKYFTTEYPLLIY